MQLEKILSSMGLNATSRLQAQFVFILKFGSKVKGCQTFASNTACLQSRPLLTMAAREEQHK